MAEPCTRRLHLWDGWTATLAEGAQAPTDGRYGPAAVAESAEILFAREAFQSRRRHRPGAEPFSLQWFLDAETARHARQGRWMPRLLEFGKHRGERLLGIGGGRGDRLPRLAR